MNYPKTIEKVLLDKVNPVLDEKKPSFLNELKIRSFNIGQHSPIFSNFMVFKASAPELIFDMDLDYDGDFVLDLGVKTKASPMPLRVSKLSLHTRLRVYARLLPDKYPYVSYAYIQMKDKPKFDINIKSLIEITAIPGLIPMIRSILNKVLGDMMIAPKYYPINVAEMMKVEVEKEDMLPFNPAIEHDKNALMGGLGSIAGGLGAGVNAVGSGVGKVGSGVLGGVGKVGGGALSGVGKVGGLSKSMISRKHSKSKISHEGKEESVDAKISDSNAASKEKITDADNDGNLNKPKRQGSFISNILGGHKKTSSKS